MTFIKLNNDEPDQWLNVETIVRVDDQPQDATVTYCAITTTAGGDPLVSQEDSATFLDRVRTAIQSS